MISTIGYEGASLEDFLQTLSRAQVDMIIDVRDRAQSRRKGFSKTALSEALATHDIDYLHLKALGDPKPGREAARSGNWELFRSIYAKVIKSTEAQEALDQIVTLANGKKVCLLCYERDPSTCHRKIITHTLKDRIDSKPEHLGVRTFEQAA